jgi:cell division protein FtsB
MNALPNYVPPPLPPEPSRRQVVRRRKRRNPHRAIAIETGFKLGVNGVLVIVAVSALVKLVPYNLAQQSKLKEIRTEVAELEGRVDHLQAALSRWFDPQQAMNVMQTESHRVDPQQRQILWLPPAMAQSPTEAIEPSNSAFYPPQPQH